MLRFMITNPFLLKFARPSSSPNRNAPSEEYVYDDEADLVRWVKHPDALPAVLCSKGSGPRTKKCDIEKGEDNKDRRMWR